MLQRQWFTGTSETTVRPIDDGRGESQFLGLKEETYLAFPFLRSTANPSKRRRVVKRGVYSTLDLPFYPAVRQLEEKKR